MKQKEQILTKDLREILKEIMQNEIERIPEYLKELEPKERLNIVLKIMPYVFPKVDTVSSKDGEPITFDF